MFVILGHAGSLVGPKKLILAYHSLSEGGADDQGGPGYVGSRQRTPVHLFEKQLQWLSQFVDFVSLDDIVESSPSDRWLVAVTFDDGYRDNVELGLPLFRRYDVPVTWFLSTRFIEWPNCLPWWDLVEYMIRHVRGVVNVVIDDDNRSYRLSVPSERDRFQEDVRKAFLTAGRSIAEALYEELRGECRRFTSLPTNAFADRELVAQAASSRWITIGGHTISHPNLASICSERVRKEVAGGRELLRKWTDESVDWFAYPYGGRDARDEVARRIVRESGFRGAVTTTRGYVEETSDTFALPRFMVPSWAGMVGFKAGILALNQVDWIVQKADRSVDRLRGILDSF